MSAIAPEERLAAALARLILDPAAPPARHIAVGAASPIPAAACWLVKLMGHDVRLSLLHRPTGNPFTEGTRELFDLTGQGRIDLFFLGGGQIDGQANLNLVGTGEWPGMGVRFPGSFGSAFMYFMTPRTILFREEHSPRVLVQKVDNISRPGRLGARRVPPRHGAGAGDGQMRVPLPPRPRPLLAGQPASGRDGRGRARRDRLRLRHRRRRAGNARPDRRRTGAAARARL